MLARLGPIESRTLTLIKISLFRRVAEINLMVQVLYSISEKA
jgi:hypothetical protein